MKQTALGTALLGPTMKRAIPLAILGVALIACKRGDSAGAPSASASTGAAVEPAKALTPGGTRQESGVADLNEVSIMNKLKAVELDNAKCRVVENKTVPAGTQYKIQFDVKEDRGRGTGTVTATVLFARAKDGNGERLAGNLTSGKSSDSCFALYFGDKVVVAEALEGAKLLPSMGSKTPAENLAECATYGTPL